MTPNVGSTKQILAFTATDTRKCVITTYQRLSTSNHTLSSGLHRHSTEATLKFLLSHCQPSITWLHSCEIERLLSYQGHNGSNLHFT